MFNFINYIFECTCRYETTNIPWSGRCFFEDCATNVFILNLKAERGFPKLLESTLNESGDSSNKRRKRLRENKDKMSSSDSDCEVIELDDSIIQ